MEYLYVLHVDLAEDTFGNEMYWSEEAFRARIDNLEGHGSELPVEAQDLDTMDKIVVQAATWTKFQRLETGGFWPIETGDVIVKL